VINAGIPGDTSRQARERLDHDVIAYHPHVVTISFGINDSAIDVFKLETKPRVPLDEYQGNLLWIVKQLRSRNIIPVLMTPNPVAWTDELKRLYGKPPYRPDQPDGWNVLLKDYSQAVRRIAKDQQVPLVDTYRLFTEYSAAPGHNLNDLMLDGMHPANSGHTIIADHIMARLKELEREKP
jgi:lysophospholipase L1-like esterase